MTWNDLILFCPNRNRVWSSHTALASCRRHGPGVCLFLPQCSSAAHCAATTAPGPARRASVHRRVRRRRRHPCCEHRPWIFSVLVILFSLTPRPIPISPSAPGRAVYPLKAHCDAQDTPPLPASYATSSSIAYIKSSPSICREKTVLCCPQTSG